MKDQQPWNVYLDRKCIEVVLYNPECDAEYVKKSLVEQDGFDSAIVVVKAA